MQASQLHSEGLALGVLALVTGTTLVLGFLTPLVAGVSALADIAVWLWHPAWVSSSGLSECQHDCGGDRDSPVGARGNLPGCLLLRPA